ncbi:MAG: radical SAM protein [Peptostreptococcaceae bacterium]
MFTIELVTNTGCNFGCYFCFAHKQNNTKVNPENLEFVLKNINTLTTEKEIFIKVYGGEVLVEQNLFRDLLAIIKQYKYIDKDHDYSVSLISNFSVFPKEDVMSLMEELNVDLTVSMEINEDYHNEIRHFKNNKNIKTYDIVMGNINKYVAMTGRYVTIQTVMTPTCIEHIDDYIEFIDKFKENKNLKFHYVPMFGKDEITKESLLLMEDALRKHREYFIKCVNEGLNNITPFHEYRSLMSLYLVTSGTFTPTHCTAGHNQITLVGEEHYPCSRFYHNGYTSFKYEADNLIEDYNGSKDKLYSITKHDTDCLNCQMVNKFGCIGRCAQATVMNDMELIEEVCDYNKIIGKHAVELAKEAMTNQRVYDIFNRMSTYLFRREFSVILKEIGGIL